MYYELFGDVVEILRENFKLSLQDETYAVKKQNLEKRFAEAKEKLIETDKELFHFGEEEEQE